MRLHQAVMLITCLSLSLCVRSSRDFEVQQGCSPSSCGQLHDIRYPFRLQGDPPNCGDSSYELSCDGNMTILDFDSRKFYVRSIAYNNKTIKISNTVWAGGCCVLSSQHPGMSRELLYDYRRFHYTRGSSVASFMNCSRKIQSSKHRPVSCLSGKNSYVYVVLDGYSVADLAPSCRFLTQVNYNSLAGTGQVLELLQEGTSLTWDTLKCRSPSSLINYCFVEIRRVFRNDPKSQYFFHRIVSPLSYQKSFLSCLHDSDDLFCESYGTYRFGFVLVVLIDVLLLLVLARLSGRIVFAPLVVSGLLAYKFWEMRVPIDAVEKFLRTHQSLTPSMYAYMDIIAMTRHFKDKLGHGGFGSVYKGELLGGYQVAVKMLENSQCNGDDFISEVSTIGRIHHVNVVHLVGFSSEGTKRALVYEYLPKGSLDKYIFSSHGKTQRPFTWDKLVDIALGVARGIDYLHQGCDMRILHFDIKPHNILLDNCFNPKVADFGLAKLFPRDYSVVAVSAARGTIGYIAPELVSRSFGSISYKSDVYSFGMLLMEMAGGRRNVEPKVDNTSQVYYPSWIYDQLGNHNSAVHDIDHNVISVGEIEKKLSIIGLWCIQTRPHDRPPMSRVIEMLQAGVDTLQMPPKPFLSAGTTNSMSIKDLSMETSSTTLSFISEHGSLAENVY